MDGRVWRLLGTVQLLFMAAIFAVCALLGGCDSQVELASGAATYMKCHWTFVACSVFAVAGFVIALVAQTAKEAQARRFLAVALIAVFAAIAYLPTPLGVGICASADMACHLAGYLTWGLCAAGIILALIQAVKADPASAERPKMQL